MDRKPSVFTQQLLHETGTFVLAMMFAATVSGGFSYLLDLAFVAITGSSAEPFVYGFAGTLAFYVVAVSISLHKSTRQ